MIAEAAVDYARLLPLHECGYCGDVHRLQEYPVDGGYIVAVVCGSCRTNTGLPRRYSTESAVLPTLLAATLFKDHLLAQPVLPTDMKHIQWCGQTSTWAVRIRRKNQRFNRSGFSDPHEAVRARDEWLAA